MDSDDNKKLENDNDIIMDENQNTTDETNIFNNIENNEIINVENNVDIVAEEIQDDSDENNITNEPIEEDSKKHRHYFVAKDSSKKKMKIVLIALFVLLVNAIILFGVLCTVNRLNINVYKNVHIFGQDISNYTLEQVVTSLNQKSNNIKETFNIDVNQEGKKIYDIKAEDIDFKIDIEKTSGKIMGFGRKDNFLIDNIKVLKALFYKNEITPEYTYTEDKIDNIIKNIELTIEDRYSDDTYNIDEVKKILTITRGKTGNSIDLEKMKQDIFNMLKEFKSTNYNLNIVTKKPTEINFEELYNVVKREPEDAYIDTAATPPEFINEKNGYDIDLAKLKETLNKDENKVEGISVEFPLIIIEPKVKLSDITYTLYNDKLAGYTTYFDSTQKARVNNLGIALKYLNGTIVMPGKTFSYYERIGETTYSKGYQDAATFKGGTVVYEVGGGICQTSSTLYNTVLLSNLEIIERHQHGLPVGYIPPSRDATVYGNVLDFKFKNTRNYPIKIVTTFSESGNMNISIYGTKEKQEYAVTLSSKVLYSIPYTTRYTYDQYVNSGVKSVIANGVNGYASEAYITKKLNGVEVSSTLLSKDVYKAQQAVMKIGTKVETKDPVINDPNIY